ncbi:MAG TPA: hypothetical protein PLV93_10605 [Microthrixaceae bacterium]|nr:hypothetical protein [Microthrixaceae bacterium]
MGTTGISNALPTGIPALDFAHGCYVWGEVRQVLLDHGQRFDRPDGPQPIFDPPLLSTPKECFRNAGLAAQEHESLRYAEGFAFPAVVRMPMAHAWLIDEAGEVVDPTWSDGADYFGIIVPTDRMTALTVETGMWGVLGSLHAKAVRRYFNLP